jgi:porin
MVPQTHGLPTFPSGRMPTLKGPPWEHPRRQRSVPQHRRAGHILPAAVLFAAGLCLAAGEARAEPYESPFHEWKEIRSQILGKGIRLETVNTTDVLSNVRGGISRGTEAPGNIDLMLTLDAEKLLGWKGGTFFVYGLGNYGNNPSRDVGDAQGVSNIAAPNTWKLFEAWYQHNLFDEKVSILAGLYDVTSEFQVVRDASELFVNSSFGTTPEFASSGRNGLSTFPTTAAGLRVQVEPVPRWAFRAAVMDGVPGDPGDPKGTQITIREDHGVFFVAELSYDFFDEKQVELSRKETLKAKPRRKARRRIGRAADMEYDGKYAVGVWNYTTKLDDLRDVDVAGNPIQRRGTYGFYGLAERSVYKEREDPTQELTLFAQVGLADSRVNRFSSYFGGGAVYSGLIPGRGKDQIGLAVGAAQNGSRFESAQRNAGRPATKSEIVLEFTYAALLMQDPDLVIQPDFQYVINPGTDPRLNNAWVVGVRIEASLEWFR